MTALPISVKVDRRTVSVAGALAAACFALLVLSVATGEYAIPLDQVVATLFGGGDQGTQFVIETLRLPRAVTGLLVGGCLGASGAIFQTITRNALGSPDVIGFTAGASAAAVAEIIVFGGGTFAIAAGSVVGGLATALVVYLLAMRHGSLGYRLVLVGIGISAMLTALTDYLITRARLEEAAAANIWRTGSLNGRGWEHVRPIVAVLIVLIPLVVMLARPLRMLELGDDAARALGVAVERSRLALIVAGVVLAAVATAATGPILFVALAAPQLARRLTRASGPAVGTSALMGAALLVAADLLAQHLFEVEQLPVGVATGVIGGVYLMWLLAREWRKGSG